MRTGDERNHAEEKERKKKVQEEEIRRGERRESYGERIVHVVFGRYTNTMRLGWAWI